MVWGEEEYKEDQVVLLDGPNEYSGNVHVFRDGKLWSVCDDAWTTQAGNVVCRSIGYSHAVSVHSRGFFGDSQFGELVDMSFDLQCFINKN